MKSRKELIKQKNIGIFAVIIGLFLTLFGVSSYIDAEVRSMRLGSVKLEAGVLK